LLIAAEPRPFKIKAPDAQSAPATFLDNRACTRLLTHALQLVPTLNLTTTAAASCDSVLATSKYGDFDEAEILFGEAPISPRLSPRN
jgi:hypothetical protein